VVFFSGEEAAGEAVIGSRRWANTTGTDEIDGELTEEEMDRLLDEAWESEPDPRSDDDEDYNIDDEDDDFFNQQDED
jgi:hypothetical protein